MSTMLGDVCQVLELCKKSGYIENNVTLEDCKKVEKTETSTETSTGNSTEEKPVEGGKVVPDYTDTTAGGL